MSMLRAIQRNRLHVDLTVATRGASVIALCLLTACATRLDQAPVVDRTAPLGTAAQPPVPLGPPPPGYYRVKPGDTLYRIALENGQNYRDIATWNNLTNPNQIEVDQLLRVVPPGANASASTPGVVTAPVPGVGVAPGAPVAPAAGSAAQPPLYGSAANAAQPQQPPASAGDMAAAPGSLALAWPVRGPVLNGFDDSKNKGINIGGAAGDPVKAAGDGRVVYAGNGLRGYGNLIIIKHDATFLTAYAHNRTLMVKEGDAVTKGQKIAEMGNTDSDRVMLHFEVRRQGKPVDPLKYLPPQ
ncbi:peptidoglycan DD-metalloendopeptidase family protein [Paraburkholderia unamae]|uniref:Murein DD-endopeptidase MepM/ murein hydrolase activator NlpD n=1 Tax=Paraburkholderia unamae TaxID=219649 RepID=A0ABX5KDW9_9BURK|nr:peptidoglycan DD-metalloendopeptidase family protein [Paraburkholderia unamae]PVX71752.1 murein DD-endopeptidase MepM/ murein hydrolase activator NlpD [Paraburkholderia unamae]CAG9258908.1 Lipoprotein NlpD/LppB homolog [Paraburkholderia unamae]